MQPEPQKPTPSPSSQPQPQLAPKSKSPTWLIGGVAAVALAAGAYFTGLGPFAHRESDTMSKQQAQQEVAAFQQAVGDFAIVNLNDPQEKAKALASLHLSAADAQEILQSAESGKSQLAMVTVWDNSAEDGDILGISSLGYSVKVPLFHQPTTVIIPVTPGGTIQFTGQVDGGGGGVTAGIRMSSGDVPIPPLDPGQTVSMPVK